VVVFLCILAGLGVIYDSQATNRDAAGGGGALTGSPPCFLLVIWESYMTPSRTAMHFCIAIRIKVNMRGIAYNFFYFCCFIELIDIEKVFEFTKIFESQIRKGPCYLCQ
jgi:hypothetical protein